MTLHDSGAIPDDQDRPASASSLAPDTAPGSRFAKIPVDMIGDERLTLRDWKVYAALRIFSFKTGQCHPKRETLAKLTGLRETRISSATARLERLGWIRKTGNGGRGCPASYRVLDAPDRGLFDETYPESGTVSDGKTVPVSGTKTVPVSGTVSGKTVPVSGTRKREIKDIEKRVREGDDERRRSPRSPPPPARAKAPTVSHTLLFFISEVPPDADEFMDWFNDGRPDGWMEVDPYQEVEYWLIEQGNYRHADENDRGIVKTVEQWATFIPHETKKLQAGKPQHLSKESWIADFARWVKLGWDFKMRDPAQQARANENLAARARIYNPKPRAATCGTCRQLGDALISGPGDTSHHCKAGKGQASPMAGQPGCTGDKYQSAVTKARAPCAEYLFNVPNGGVI